LEEEKKLMILKEKEKELKLNEIKVKELKKMIQYQNYEQTHKGQGQPETSMKEVKHKRNIKYAKN
jgi:hypothetical protein